MKSRGPVVFVYSHKGRDEHGPLRTLTNTNFEHMGLSMGPCEQFVLIYTLHQFSVINSVSFAHPSSWWPWPS